MASDWPYVRARHETSGAVALGLMLGLWLLPPLEATAVASGTTAVHVARYAARMAAGFDLLMCVETIVSSAGGASNERVS